MVSAQEGENLWKETYIIILAHSKAYFERKNHKNRVNSKLTQRRVDRIDGHEMRNSPKQKKRWENKECNKHISFQLLKTTASWQVKYISWKNKDSIQGL